MRYAICDFCGKKVDISTEEIISVEFIHFDVLSKEVKDCLAELDKKDICIDCRDKLTVRVKNIANEIIFHLQEGLEDFIERFLKK